MAVQTSVVYAQTGRVVFLFHHHHWCRPRARRRLYQVPLQEVVHYFLGLCLFPKREPSGRLSQWSQVWGCPDLVLDQMRPPQVVWPASKSTLVFGQQLRQFLLPFRRQVLTSILAQWPQEVGHLFCTSFLLWFFLGFHGDGWLSGHRGHYSCWRALVDRDRFAGGIEESDGYIIFAHIHQCFPHHDAPLSHLPLQTRFHQSWSSNFLQFFCAAADIPRGQDFLSGGYHHCSVCQHLATLRQPWYSLADVGDCFSSLELDLLSMMVHHDSARSL